MEPGTHPQLRKQRRKAFMACIHCRACKTGCDGKSPACSRCVGRGLRCEYLPIRKMRGPGKKKRSVKHLEQRPSLPQTEFQGRVVLDNNENYSSNNDGSSAAMRDIPEPHVHLELSGESGDLEALLQQNFPMFLEPENNMVALQDLKRAIKEEQTSPEGFVRLISQDQIQHIFEITYNEIMAVCPIFDLPTLSRLNAEQHAVSSAHPASNPARWAIITTWIAMGVLFKTTSGSEDELNYVSKAYYRNAVLVLPDLILQPANKETIQALLFMAMYAECSMDHRSYVMLVTNAVRQIEILTPRLSEVRDRCEKESCKNELSFAQLQDIKVANNYGMTLLLGSLVV